MKPFQLTRRVWDRASRKLTNTLAGHRGPVNAVALQKDQAVTGCGGGEVRLWNVKAGSCVRIFEGHINGVTCVDFKDDFIISGSTDCTIKIWRASSGECLSILWDHTLYVCSLQYVPHRKQLISAGYDRSIMVWNLKDPKDVTLIKEFAFHKGPIFDVKFDERRIIRQVKVAYNVEHAINVDVVLTNYSAGQDARVVIMDFPLL